MSLIPVHHVKGLKRCEGNAKGHCIATRDLKNSIQPLGEVSERQSQAGCFRAPLVLGPCAPSLDWSSQWSKDISCSRDARITSKYLSLRPRERISLSVSSNVPSTSFVRSPPPCQHRMLSNAPSTRCISAQGIPKAGPSNGGPESGRCLWSRVYPPMPELACVDDKIQEGVP
jgi:hypothetical protein